MTVHKAKGLGFPVVIVLLYGEKRRRFDATVLRSGGGIRLVRLTRDLARRDSELSGLYDEEVITDKVNRLNALYVALTRAKEELYVIGVKREKDTFPFDLLPESGFEPGAAAADRPVTRRSSDQPSAVLSHDARTLPSSLGSRPLNLAERRRGDLVHAALARIRFATPGLEADLEKAVSHAARALRLDAPDSGLSTSAARLIGCPPLVELFEEVPGRRVFTEWEVCSREGRLFRMDRVVVDPGRVAVIDWKTGAEEEQAERHEEQVSNYAEMLRAVFPGRRVEAFLAYVDRGETRRVL